MNDSTREAVEAAAFRRLIDFLRQHPEVQNIDLMNLAGFCRNCLSKWYLGEAVARGVVDMDYEQARTRIYGMPYSEWKQQHQAEASAEQRQAYTQRTDKSA